jgi:hypothetical protein
MSGKSPRAGWVAVVLAGSLLAGCTRGSNPSPPPPSPMPSASVEPVAIVSPTLPPPSQAEIEAEMARAFPASPPSLEQAPPMEVPAAAPATTLATPDPQADIQRQFRIQIAQARAKAESLDAAVKQECPDLKPGELRLPEAVDQCTRLRSDAAQAVSYYDNLKKEALRAGVWIQ